MNYAVKQKLMKKCLIKNPPTSSSDVGHQQSTDGSVDVPTEVTSGGTVAG